MGNNGDIRYQFSNNMLKSCWQRVSKPLRRRIAGDGLGAHEEIILTAAGRKIDSACDNYQRQTGNGHSLGKEVFMNVEAKKLEGEVRQEWLDGEVLRAAYESTTDLARSVCDNYATVLAVIGLRELLKRPGLSKDRLPDGSARLAG